MSVNRSTGRETATAPEFGRLPSTRYGRLSAWLLLASVGLMTVNGAVLIPLFERDPQFQTPLKAYIGLILLALVATDITGLIALIKQRERSWVVWLAVILTSLVVGLEILGPFLPD